MEQIVYNTCLELLSDRGYTIVNTDEDDVEDNYTKIIGMSSSEGLICVIITSTIKFNVERIQECITILKKNNITHGIVVCKDNITPIAKKTIQESKDFKIELFYEEELSYNVTKHKLVPKHIKLSKKESQDFKKEFGNKFPYILTSDPVSKYYNYSVGDVIKVIRPDGYITYRIVK